MNVVAVPVPIEYINEHWDSVVPFIINALNYSNDDLSLGGIKSRLDTGDFLLILLFQNAQITGCCVLAVLEMDTGKRIMHIVLAGGGLLSEKNCLIVGMKLIRKMAKEQQCSHIRACGRPGWERALPELKKIRTVYECEV